MKPRDLIIPHFVSQRWTIAVGLVALILVDLLQLLIPRVIKWAVDDLASMQVDVSELLRYAGIIAVMGIFIGLFRYLWRRCLLGMSRRLEADLRDRLLQHIQTLSASYFDRTRTGDLMAHATNDIMQVRMASGMGLVALNDAVVMGAAAIGFMLYIHVQLTLYVLIPMPFIVIGTRLLSRRMHRRYQDVQAAFAALTETVRERCAGMHMIKAHNEEARALEAVHDASMTYVDENMRLVGVTAVFFPMMVLFTNLSLAAVLYFGGRRTIMGDITTGDFVAFISYLNLLSWPMMALGWVSNLIQRGGASLARLHAVFQQEPEIMAPARAEPLGIVKGHVAFEQVGFAYDTGNGAARVLSDITLSLSPGQVLGVVGPPGSGKSTLLSLIPRLYDPTRGRITVDGHDLRNVSPEQLRRQIAYVPQEPFLFAGTIRDNILFGCPAHCMARLDRTLEEAGLTGTIDALASGLETRVGEKGVLLSGGQKQRVALARALLIDAPIILLDDPISQVDTTTAGIIVRAIRRMTGTKTIIVASHRLEAVDFADTIITLHHGRIVESGTHEQLIDQGGYYAKVHRLQEPDYAL